MPAIDTSAKTMVNHWSQAAKDGLMSKSSASAMKGASNAILQSMDNWEKIDIRSLDVKKAMDAFERKRGGDFAPNSRETYKRRFTQAVKLFLEYADNPQGWKPTQRKRRKKVATAPSRQTRTAKRAPRTAAARSASLPATGQAYELVDYPYPLRPGRIAMLRLPSDLQLSEVPRLAAHLRTLAVDFEPSGKG